MAEALEAPVDITGYFTGGIEFPSQYVPVAFTWPRKAQILHRDELGNGEAVMHLYKIELLHRVGDTRLQVSLARGNARGVSITAVPSIVRHFLAVA